MSQQEQPHTANEPCSVCFERFRTVYCPRLQCTILLNAVKLEGLLYHPSCIEKAWDGVNVDVAADPHLALRRRRQ